MERGDPLTQAFATRYRETCDVVQLAPRAATTSDVTSHSERVLGTTRPRKRPVATLVAHRLGLCVCIARSRPLHVGRSVWLRAPRRGSLGAFVAASGPPNRRSWPMAAHARARGSEARARGTHTARMRAPRMRMRLKPSIEMHAKRRMDADARISAIKGACGESDRFRRPKNAAIGGGRERNRLRGLAPEGAGRARGMRGRPAPPASAAARRARISGTRRAESSRRRETRGCPSAHFTCARTRRSVRVLRAGGATPH